MKVNIKHLAIMLILFLGLTYLIMQYIIVLLIWSYVGDGVYPKSWDFYINIIYSLSAIAFLFPVLIYRTKKNKKLKNTEKVNDYFIVGLCVIIFSIIIISRSYIYN